MVLAGGLASFERARALAGRFGGHLSLAAGVGGMLTVRPLPLKEVARLEQIASDRRH
jgi:hypothetical protein